MKRLEPNSQMTIRQRKYHKMVYVNFATTYRDYLYSVLFAENIVNDFPEMKPIMEMEGMTVMYKCILAMHTMGYDTEGIASFLMISPLAVRICLDNTKEGHPELLKD